MLADRLTGRNPDAVTGSRISTKLKVMGVDLAVMGEKDAPTRDDEVVTYVEPARGIYKKLIVRDGRLGGRDPARRRHDRAGAAPGLRSRDASCPTTAPSCSSRCAGGERRQSVQALPDDAQICNCNGVSKGAIVAR